MTPQKTTPTMTLERAREIAADRATVDWFGKEGVGISLQITGCFFDEGHEVARDISREAHPGNELIQSRKVSATAGLVVVYL
jgi:hypothetical protein